MALLRPVDKNSSTPYPTNPVQEAMESLGLSATKFSALLGVSQMTLRFALVGEAVKPSSVIRGMQGIGYDPAQVLERYKAWRSWNRERLVAAANGEFPPMVSPNDHPAKPEPQPQPQPVAQPSGSAQDIGKRLACAIRAFVDISKAPTSDLRVKKLEEWMESLDCPTAEAEEAKAWLRSYLDGQAPVQDVPLTFPGRIW